jgi:uncharacterized lipoprotein YmbA
VRRVNNGEQQTGRVRVKEAVAGEGYHELVTAHARAIDTASRSIAEAIRSSRQKEVAAAPPGTAQ